MCLVLRSQGGHGIFPSANTRQITVKYIDSLVDLIQTNISSVPEPSSPEKTAAFAMAGFSGPLTDVFARTPRLPSMFAKENTAVSEATVRHFREVSAGIQERFGRKQRDTSGATGIEADTNVW